MTVLGKVGRDRRDRVDPHRCGQAVPLGVVEAGQDHGGRAVAGRADVEQVQRVGDDGARHHVGDADLLAVAGVGVRQTVLGVLDLHLREVLLGRAVEVHPAPRVEREVRRVRHPEQPEAQPVRVVPALPRVGREESLRGGVRADHERHLAEPGEDPCPGGVEGLGAGRAGGVRRRDPRAVPARAPGRRSRRRRSRRSRCAPSRRRRSGRRRARRCPSRPARPGRRARRTSTKLLPHLPHGCMPTPATATSWVLTGRPPRPAR